MKTIKTKLLIILFCTACLTTQVSAETVQNGNTTENVKAPIPEDLLGGIIHFFIDLIDSI